MVFSSSCRCGFTQLGLKVIQRGCHGGGTIAGNEHADKPFAVSGILARTGTPVDRSVHIGLEGIEALHVDWFAGMPMPGRTVSAEQARTMALKPRSVTAVLVGLKSRSAVFAMQRRVADFADEPLMAVLPGVALDDLWDAVGVGEQALRLMSLLVALVSLAGLVAVIVTGLDQRRRELAVLRSVGAGSRAVFALLITEGTLVSAAGVVVGFVACAIAVPAAAPWIEQHYGIALAWRAPDATQALIATAVVLAGMLASVLPGWRAYRLSLSDGLQPRG